jgi:glycosyltransferase involved in cell wall biosynthesis
MLVKDLIRDTIWTPGKDYDPSHKPKISVLLPAFRRAKSGLFRRCVESILSQTLQDIELIIIDDASTDGTADQTREFMQKDGRVSSLRHPKNIGLPAISEYEGYLKARSDRLSFAFDDTMFNEDALEKLLKESEKAPHAMIYGHIVWLHKDINTGEISRMQLGAGRSQGSLRTSNFIPNNGVLISKSIIEDVGFYDPHIVIARVCDWDLWCRVGEKYELRFVDVLVGQEDGPMTSDSLGNTYALDSWAVDEWMRTPRNERLLPANLPDYEVFSADSSHGLSTRTVCESLAKKHANARGWKLEPATAGAMLPGDGSILVVNLHYNASTTLYFDMLPEDVAGRVRVMSFHSGFGVEELMRATCVIFVRHISVYRPWIDAAKALGIPAYFFLDDNLPLLAQSGEIVVPGENLEVSAMRKDLKLFDGVLLSSPNLLEYFEENDLHANLQHFPVSCVDQRMLPLDYQEPKEKNETVIAFAGGSHRNKGLWQVVFPALKRLASQGTRIHVVAPEPDRAEHLDLLNHLPKTMRVTTLPFEEGYLFAMRRFARFSPDLMIHAPSDTKNNRFKTLHPLLTAKLLGATAVVPSTAPYDDIARLGVAIVVEDALNESSWHDYMSRILAGQYDLARIRLANDRYCAEHFSGRINSDTLTAMLRHHGGEVTWPEQARRLHQLTGWTRARAGGTQVVSGATLQVNADTAELAEFRKMMRYSWRHRILSRRADLWNTVSPAFSTLKQRSVEMGWKKKGASLELSDSLHGIPFREYSVRPKEGKLASVTLALAVDFVAHGLVGVEVVTPRDEIREHIVLELNQLKLDEPIRFELSDTHIRDGETWRIRVFAKSAAPVYVYEFINKRWFGLRFARPTPFMEMVTAT